MAYNIETHSDSSPVFVGSHLEGNVTIGPGLNENSGNVFVTICPHGVDVASIRLIKGDKQLRVEYKCIGKPEKHIVEVR